MKHVTIKDIARLAGVSVTTVSRALNDAPEINPETKERVLDICRQEGYRTNLLARSLISSRTHVIGVILPDIAEPFYAALALHIETCARQFGYQVMLCGIRSEDGDLNALFDFLISQRVDGILLTGAVPGTRELLRRYQAAVPIVLLANCMSMDTAWECSSVCIDNYAGSRLAAQYLHGLGHQDVVYLGLRRDSFAHLLRHKGFVDTAGELGMQVSTIENPTGHSSIVAGLQLARELFLAPFRQTAIFAASDLLALGVLQAADELGVSIPEQVSLIGFDNIDYAALPKIRLTTISRRPEAVARSGVQVLMELINSEDRGEYTRKLLAPALVERQTCRRL